MKGFKILNDYSNRVFRWHCESQWKIRDPPTKFLILDSPVKSGHIHKDEDKKVWIGSDRNRIYIMSVVQSRKVFSWFIGYKAPLVQNFICPENLRWRHKRIFSRLALILKLNVLHKFISISCRKTLTLFSAIISEF